MVQHIVLDIDDEDEEAELNTLDPFEFVDDDEAEFDEDDSDRGSCIIEFDV